MKSIKWVQVILLFVLLWGIDFLIKAWFVRSHFHFSSSFLNLSLIENHGIVLGGLKELPLSIRTVFLCTTGFAMVLAFPILMSIWSCRSRKVVVGLTLIFVGILGNISDRLLYGHVVDFISFNLSLFATPVFNMADVYLVIGNVLFFSGISREISHHFPENDLRNTGWINPQYQIRFALSLLMLVQGISLVFFIFSYSFLKYSLVELEVPLLKTEQYLNYYLMAYFFIFLLTGLVSFLYGKFLSFRIAGPMYAIENFIRDTLSGKLRTLKFREGDHLKDLEAPLSELNQAHCKKTL